MFKTIIKWLLSVCFKAVINEIVVEYTSRKEVTYEETTQTSEEGK